MRGMLAAAAAVSLTALGTMAAPQATLAANVRTITGFTAGGELEWEMSEIFQGGYCSASSGNTCEPVEYLSDVPVVGELSGLAALTVALWSTPSPTTVVGFSQGAVISSEWLRGNRYNLLAPSPEDLSFVLVANPHRKYGGSRPAYDADIQPTPTTRYDVLDIVVEYDGVADFPDDPFNLLAVANALVGFQYIHIFGYADVDLENAEKLVWSEGNTTYVLIRRENIPLLEPLRELGLGALADGLNAPLKAVIDSAYDRNYPGLVSQDKIDSALQQFSSPQAVRSDADPVATAAAASAINRSSAVAELPQEPGTVQPHTEGSEGSEDVEGAESLAIPESGESVAEDPEPASEADDPTLETEAEPSPAEADEVDAESDPDSQDHDSTPDIEVDPASQDDESSSDVDSTDNSVGSDEATSGGGEADGENNTATAASGNSEPKSESSSE
ncbi:MAG: PE-PPE domain-containing protein [Actinomycetia bacterium]|nr:PE-PPE domain-containing protein [Actinomycetes bacterium]